MSQILHIARKDLTRLRWMLLFWVALVGARVVLFSMGPFFAFADEMRHIVFLQLREMLTLVELLMMAIVTARLVHEDAAVGVNAFWLTRPYHPRSLIAAKLLVAAIGVALPAALGDVAELLIARARASDLIVALPGVYGGHARWVLALLVLGALTASLGTFALAIVGIAVASTILLSLFLIGAILFLGDTASSGGGRNGDDTSAFIAWAAYFATALGVIAYQYRYRRRGRAVALAVAGLAATLILPAYWPWRFAQRPQPDPGAWARNREATPAQVAVDRPPTVIRLDRPTPDGRTRLIVTEATLAGTPPEFEVSNVDVQSVLELSNGSRVQTQNIQPSDVVEFEPARTGRSPLQAALADVKLLTEPTRRAPPIAVVASLTEADFVRHRGTSARLAATVDFDLLRSSEIGVLALTKGAMLRRGRSVIEVLSIDRSDDRCAVAIREWSVDPLLAPAHGGQLQFVLRNRVRREAVTGDQRFMSGATMASSLFIVPLIVPDRSRFRPGYQRLKYPQSFERSGRGPAIDAAWLDEAELVVVETAYAGSVRRSITIDDFAIPKE